MTPNDVRSELVDALRLDLIGPGDDLGSPDELLPQAPSGWYLTGFLVPTEAGESQRVDEESTDTMDALDDSGGSDDAVTPEPAAARRAYMPSSMGMSLLVSPATRRLEIAVRWGDYFLQEPEEGDEEARREWKRSDRQETVVIELPEATPDGGEQEVPNSRGLHIAWSLRGVSGMDGEGGLAADTRALSVFLVNRRRPAPDDVRDEAFVFQANLNVKSEAPLVARPNLRSLKSDDWDERVADLQYRDAYEFAIGHGVSTDAIIEDGQCRSVRTRWIPQAEVQRVAPEKISGVELEMEALAKLTDGADAQTQLGNFVPQYRQWIADQRTAAPQSPARRKETAHELLNRADTAANRIQQGIDLLDDEECLEAFRIANRAMAAQSRRRLGRILGKDITPEWRPFQLAFLLMNLPGIADPKHADREVVDLLFFPTGGGKTEAYLGLAAFTLVLRRLRNPGISSAGLSVLMRYTLRLLTLDQLGRAAALVCAGTGATKRRRETGRVAL